MSNELLLSVKRVLSNGPMSCEEIINKLRDDGCTIDLKCLNQLIRKHGDIFARSASKGIIILKKRAKVQASVRG